MHTYRKMGVFFIQPKSNHGPQVEFSNVEFVNGFGVKCRSSLSFSVVFCEKNSRPGIHRQLF